MLFAVVLLLLIVVILVVFLVVLLVVLLIVRIIVAIFITVLLAIVLTVVLLLIERIWIRVVDVVHQLLIILELLPILISQRSILIPKCCEKLIKLLVGFPLVNHRLVEEAALFIER